MRLDAAQAEIAASHPEANLVVHYYPFMIDPATAPDGAGRRPVSMYHHMCAIGHDPVAGIRRASADEAMGGTT